MANDCIPVDPRTTDYDQELLVIAKYFNTNTISQRESYPVRFRYGHVNFTTS